MANCFLISQIGDKDSDERVKADWIRDGIVRPVLEGEPFNYSVIRADQIAEPGMITDQVIIAIAEADLVVADLSDYNPNVYYELGIAHVFRRPIIHMIEMGQRLPFDLQDFRTVVYGTRKISDFEAAKTDLKAQAEAVRKTGYKVSNPVTRALGHQKLAASGDEKERLIAALIQRMSAIDGRLQQLESARDIDRNLVIRALSGPPPWPPSSHDPAHLGIGALSSGAAIPINAPAGSAFSKGLLQGLEEHLTRERIARERLGQRLMADEENAPEPKAQGKKAQEKKDAGTKGS